MVTALGCPDMRLDHLRSVELSTELSRGRSSQPEFLEAVASDLKYLAETWGGSIDEHSLRRSSNVLRVLLVDDAFGRAWRMVGQHGEPTVEAVDLARTTAGLERRLILFAAAGGGSAEGMFVASAFAYAGTLSDDMIASRSREPPLRRYKLSEYLASGSLIFEGEEVRRRDVVKYFANKLGGAHYDLARKKTEAAFRTLDSALNAGHIVDKRLVHFELLSIGQALARSEDALALRDLCLRGAE